MKPVEIILSGEGERENDGGGGSKQTGLQAHTEMPQWSPAYNQYMLTKKIGIYTNFKNWLFIPIE
jgi:hypothetical protein